MGGSQRQVTVDFCMEDATYHMYVKVCCQSQVQITYGACVRCILGAVQSHMIVNKRSMKNVYPSFTGAMHPHEQSEFEMSVV